MTWQAKAGVNLSALRPELSRLEALVSDVYEECGIKAVVTCTDGDHAGRISYHNPPYCAAFDLRVQHIGGSKAQAVLHAILKRRIGAAYPDLYDVLLERRATLHCRTCGKRWAGLPEIVAGIRSAHLEGHPDCQVEFADHSHIHVEPSPLLALQLFGHSHIPREPDHDGAPRGTVPA